MKSFQILTRLTLLSRATIEVFEEEHEEELEEGLDNEDERHDTSSSARILRAAVRSQGVAAARPCRQAFSGKSAPAAVTALRIIFRMDPSSPSFFFGGAGA